MEIGHLNQKASPWLSGFVIMCAIISVGLLYVMQKSEALADHVNNSSDSSSIQSYLN